MTSFSLHLATFRPTFGLEIDVKRVESAGGGRICATADTRFSEDGGVCRLLE